MRSIVAPLPHDLAVAAALSTLGQPVGYAAPPVGALDAVRAAPNDPSKTYLVIWPVAGGSRDGSAADPFADVELVYRLWIVGGRPDLVRSVEGELEAALLGATVAGRVVTRVELSTGGVTADLDSSPTIYSATPELRLSSTPA